MRKLLIVFIALCTNNVFAQDVIVLKDGSTVISKVLEINQNDIKYKKYSNLNGPTYTINKIDIMSINYENGDRDVFKSSDIDNNEKPVMKNEQAPKQVIKQPDNNNDYILEIHNRILESKEKKKGNDAKGAFVVLGVRSSSVMSTEDIEISFERKLLKKPGGLNHPYYYISIKNKTDKIIYVDKGNCFRVEKLLNKNYCYYDNSQQLTVTTGSSSGGALGLGSVASVLGIGGAVGQLAGGVSLGGSSLNSKSTTYSQQRILAIPPHSSQYLSEQKWVQTKKGGLLSNAEYEEIEQAEDLEMLGIPFIDRGFVKYGEKKILGENDNIWGRDYYITYSPWPNFDEYSTINFSLYVHEVIGTSGALLFHSENVEDYLNSPNPSDIIIHHYLSKK